MIIDILKLIDQVYELVLEKKSDVKKFNFDEFFALIIEKNNISSAKTSKIIGEFYTELALDNRFVLISNNDKEFSLREWINYSEYKKQINQIIKIDEEVFDDDYVEIKRKKALLAESTEAEE